MTAIATSRNLSMDTAGLIGRASGAGKSTILDAAAVRSFSNTLSSAEVASAISAAVSGIDLSGYLPLSGGTLSGNLGVSNIVGPGGSTSLVLNNAGTGGTFLQDNGGNRAWIGGSGVGIYTACYSIHSNLYDLGLTTRFWRKLFVGSVVPLSADLIIRDGTTAQAVRIDKTYTSDTNCEFLRVGFTGTNYDLCSRVGSAGGSNQPIRVGHIAADGTTFTGLTVATNGTLLTPSGSITTTGVGIGAVNTGFYSNTSGQIRAVLSGAVPIGFFASGIEVVGYFGLSGSSPGSGASDARIYRNVAGQTDIRGDLGLRIRNLANSADAVLSCAAITASGNLTCVPATATITLGTNGQFAIEMTSNTAGNLVYRGSDGTTRRFAFTVS